MKKDYDYAYAVVRVDEYQGPDCAIENKVTIKEIVHNEEEAAREVARLNGIAKVGVRYFSQVTRLIKSDSLPQKATREMGKASNRPQLTTLAVFTAYQSHQRDFLTIVDSLFEARPFGYSVRNGHAITPVSTGG